MKVLPSVSVILIDTRSKTNPDWVKLAIDSIKNQYYPNYELIVESNAYKKEKIGVVWNRAIKKAQGELCVFIGDDDYITPDYLIGIVSLYVEMKKKNNKIVGSTSYLIAFGEELRKKQQMNIYPTGLYEKEYLLKYPFDEKLISGIDTKYVKDMKARGNNTVVARWHYGYYYRQHDGMTSGRSLVEVKK